MLCFSSAWKGSLMYTVEVKKLEITEVCALIPWFKESHVRKINHGITAAEQIQYVAKSSREIRVCAQHIRMRHRYGHDETSYFKVTRESAADASPGPLLSNMMDPSNARHCVYPIPQVDSYRGYPARSMFLSRVLIRTGGNELSELDYHKFIYPQKTT